MSSKHSSHLRLVGRVEHALRTPETADVLLIVQDTNDNEATAKSHSGVTFAKNLIMLLLKGDWALSCNFVCPGDEIEITRFDIERTAQRTLLGGEGLRIALPGFAATSGHALPTNGSNSTTSNAPDLVTWASSQCKLALPSTTLCITPSPATELIVLRKKRVVINFANVGNLELIDVTDKERRGMRADHFFHNTASGGNNGGLLQLGAPAHHSAARFAAQRATTPGSRGGSSPLRIGARGGYAPSSPTKQHSNALSSGVAGKNCYASMDKYYDVLFGQSARINPRVAFVERLIGLKNKILDVGCGSGLYAFMLRALGTTNVTCLEKSLTMLQMLEEKNRFFDLVEGDVPDHQKKGRLRVIAADVANFRLPVVDRSSGEEGFEDFTTVLCLSVLSLLPSLQAVKDALHSISLHTRVGGQLVVSIPNADAILRRGNYQSHECFVVDRAGSTLCAGATSAMPNGHVDTVMQTIIRLPHQGVSADGRSVQPLARTGAALAAQDGIPRREVRYHGTAFHPGSTTEEGMFVSFQEHTEELLLPTALFEDAVIGVGFEMEGLFGNMCGATFSPFESDERVYVFRRCEDQFGIAD
jgi:SAM-dependent methyltransferase